MEKQQFIQKHKVFMEIYMNIPKFQILLSLKIKYV